MLKLKDLEEMGSVTFGNAENVTLSNIQDAITDLAKQNGVPVAFYKEDAKDGGLFGESYTALVAYHPEHQRDYFNMAMIMTKQGNFGNVAVYAAGKSKQMNKFARSNNSKAGFAAAVAGGGSYAVGQMIGGALGSIGKSKAKLQEEQAYYEIILGIIGSALNE